MLMRGLVIFLIVVAIISSFSLVAASMNNSNLNITNMDNKKIETKNPEFSAFTSAVCENKEKFVYCKDKIFVNCNGKLSNAVDFAECDRIKIALPASTGFAVFRKDWKDPRN